MEVFPQVHYNNFLHQSLMGKKKPVVLVARLDIGLDVTINVFAGSVGEIAV
jgi:hypothetical protein